MISFLIFLALIWLVIASIQDIKKREVPNWLSFSLILFALAFRLIYSVINSDAWFFLFGLIGFFLFFLLAYMFYYARVFAGGDAKLLMGIGAVLPLGSSMYYNLILLGTFIFLFLLIGAIYGLVYSFVLVALNRKKFSKEFFKQFKLRKNLVLSFLILALISLIFVIYSRENLLLVFPLMALIFPILLIYAKAVEESCMIKEVNSKDVVVGDWLYEEVRVGKRKIKPYWEGLSEEEVELLRRVRKKVKIKQGIPFVPCFLIAFLLFLWLWYSNWSFFQWFLFFGFDFP